MIHVRHPINFNALGCGEDKQGIVTSHFFLT
jgi:hypothetical protein